MKVSRSTRDRHADRRRIGACSGPVPAAVAKRGGGVCEHRARVRWRIAMVRFIASTCALLLVAGCVDQADPADADPATDDAAELRGGGNDGVLAFTTEGVVRGVAI